MINNYEYNLNPNSYITSNTPENKTQTPEDKTQTVALHSLTVTVNQNTKRIENFSDRFSLTPREEQRPLFIVPRPTIKDDLTVLDPWGTLLNDHSLNREKRRQFCSFLLTYKETYVGLDRLCKEIYTKESIDFLSDCSHCLEVNSDDLQTLDSLIEKYIYDNRSNTINICGATRQSIIEAFNLKNLDQVKECLRKIREEIMDLLMGNILLEPSRSQLLFNYLGEEIYPEEIFPDDQQNPDDSIAIDSRSIDG